MDLALAEGKGLILYGHKIINSGSGYMTSSMFNNIIDYAQSIGMTITDMPGLAALMVP